MNMARAMVTLGGFVPWLVGLAVALDAAPAAACGGFFCGQQPVDQTAERILFEVGQDSVTMTTQISFNGDADDFAWVLPLSDVPLAGSLEVWHQQALNALDANTGPVFLLPTDPACNYYYSCPNCGQPGNIPVLEDADALDLPFGLRRSRRLLRGGPGLRVAGRLRRAGVPPGGPGVLCIIV